MITPAIAEIKVKDIVRTRFACISKEPTDELLSIAKKNYDKAYVKLLEYIEANTCIFPRTPSGEVAALVLELHESIVDKDGDIEQIIKAVDAAGFEFYTIIVVGKAKEA